MSKILNYHTSAKTKPVLLAEKSVNQAGYKSFVSRFLSKIGAKKL